MRADEAGRTRLGGSLALVLLAVSALSTTAAAQDIADLDYEHLSFRGFAPEFGYMWTNRVENTETYGVRADLGYLGPGLRIVPSLMYWRSRLRDEEIMEFEDRLADLIADQNGGLRPTVDLGTIRYTDISLTVDAHVVWELPLDLLTFGGFGVAAHIVDGDGDVIGDTFVEDLLDSLEPGFNLHVGAEYPVTDRMRLYTVGKYEVLPDLQYFHARIGWQFMTGPNAPGEGRGDG